MNVKKIFSNLFLKIEKNKTLILVIFLAIVTIFSELHGSFNAWDEIIYNQVAREGIARGDWLTFYFYGELWFEKPPLVIWLTMFSFKFLGDSEFYAWLFPAIAGVFSVIGIYLLGKKVFNEQVASLSALILLMTPHFLLMSRNNMMDIFLLCFSIFSFLFILKSKDDSRNLILFWIFFALAFMSKSFAALVVILPVTFYYVFLYKRWDVLKNKNFYIGILAFLLIVLPWHILMTLKFGSVFWQDYLGYHVLQRYSNDILFTGNSSDILFYLKVLLKRFGSWWIVLLSLSPVLFDSFKKGENVKEIKLLLFWILFILIFFSFSATKLHHYIFPLYAPLSLIIGLGIGTSYRKRSVFMILALVIILFNVKISTILLYSDYGESKLLIPFVLHSVFESKIVFLLAFVFILIPFYGFLKKRRWCFDLTLVLIFTFSFLFPFSPERSMLAKVIGETVEFCDIKKVYLSDEFKEFDLKFTASYYAFPVEVEYFENREFIYSKESDNQCYVMDSEYYDNYNNLSHETFSCEIYN